MTYHLAAYYESHDNTANTDVNAVTDLILRQSNNHHVLDIDRFLIWAAAICPDLQRSRITLPKFRQYTLPFIRPVIDDTVRANPLQVADYRDAPFVLPTREEVAIEATHDNAGSVIDVALLALARGTLRPAPGGEVYTMRGTGGTAAVAGSWTATAVTWPDTLPAGRYACVGFEAISANCRAARLVFEDQVDRPGVVGIEDVNQQAPSMFRKGGLGVWGEFDSDRMPNIEVLAAAADATQEFYLDFVRIR